MFAKHKQTNPLQSDYNSATSSNAETKKSIDNPMNFTNSNCDNTVLQIQCNHTNPTNTNCGSNPQLLINCSTTNTNCGINPDSPPCCVQPTSDKSCIQMKKVNISNFNTIPWNVHM